MKPQPITPQRSQTSHDVCKIMWGTPHLPRLWNAICIVDHVISKILRSHDLSSCENFGWVLLHRSLNYTPKMTSPFCLALNRLKLHIKKPKIIYSSHTKSGSCLWSSHWFKTCCKDLSYCIILSMIGWLRFFPFVWRCRLGRHAEYCA